MAESVSTVFVVDDDPATRESLEFLFGTLDIHSKIYASAHDFLADFRSSSPGCLVCDVRMPDMSGLELLDRLAAMGTQLPVILITAYADVPMAIREFQSGAADFVEKPFNAQVMLERVQRILAQDLERRASIAEWDEFSRRMASLTEKEREALTMLLDGQSNKFIASRLDISERAVEMRRASVMKTLQANSLVEMIRRVTQFEMLFPKRKPGA